MKTRKEEFEKKLKVLTNHVHYLGEIYQKKDMLIEDNSDTERIDKMREDYKDTSKVCDDLLEEIKEYVK